MAWLAVDRDGVCNIYNCKPKRSCGQWVIPTLLGPVKSIHGKCTYDGCNYEF